MEKRTLLAVVLSIITISGFYFIQYTFFPPKTPVEQSATTEQNAVPVSTGDVNPIQRDMSPIPEYDGGGEETYPQTE
ncbi:MAG: membrane protein insertase YidC, partial [Spirochaetaceae bacterium]|nr:membrane protein insertase YidC [Spirochaetaceae bacterium]